MPLTSHERIMRIFRNQEVDRPALKLWGAELDPFLLHPDYAPVRQRALEVTDLFVGSGSPFHIFFGQHAKDYVELEETPLAGGWVNQRRTFHTPKGDLTELYRHSTLGEPGYILEHAVKEPEDMEKLLSIPYEPFPFSSAAFEKTKAALGDRGVVMFGLDHPGYAAQRMMGSETLAIMSIDERDMLQHFISVLASRVHQHARCALENGICAPFSWVGPEVFLPPLMSHQDFTDFVFNMDKPMCDDLKNAGCHIWVHCHGKVNDFIQDYIDLGVDILNPLEPPKNGDIQLDEVTAKYGRQIGWEGNIEIQTLLQADEETVRSEVRRCAQIGKQVNRFVLCPSAGYMEYTHPEENYLRNLMTYLNYGLECLEN